MFAVHLNLYVRVRVHSVVKRNIMDFKEIIEAWTISFKPTSQQRELAEMRGKICDECPSKEHILGLAYCKECGCPIGKKIFSTHYNPCALLKWEEIDKKYVKQKEKKTLI